MTDSPTDPAASAAPAAAGSIDVRRLAMRHLGVIDDNVDLETVLVEADYSMEWDAGWHGRQGGFHVLVNWAEKTARKDDPRDEPDWRGLYPRSRWLDGYDAADFVNALFSS